jgi:hypothetical protein
MMKLEIELLSERLASVKIGTGDVAPNDFVMTAEDIDELIEVLGSSRMALKDEVPRELGPSARVRAIGETVLHVHHTAEGQTVLCIRDPAYGWTALELSESAAQKLARALVESADR